MSENDDVLNSAAQWLGENKGVALATVVGTWGSSPRPPGSMLAIEEGGAFVGSVSGGCVEGAVVSEAQEVIAGAPPRVLDYGVSDEQAWEVGLACGGELKVFLERAVPADVLRALLQERPAALVSHLASGAHAVVRAIPSTAISISPRKRWRKRAWPCATTAALPSRTPAAPCSRASSTRRSA